MTTLILDWSDWDGAASGWVSLTRVTWRRDPDTYQVPWTRQVRVEGRTVVDVQGMTGEVLAVTWAPDGGGRRTDHVLVPAEGERLAHLLERVDPATLDPLPEDMPSATELVARTEALVARIEGGEFTGADGADGVGVESIADEDGDGVATVRLTSGAVSDLPLPRGPRGDRGERGLQGDRGFKGDRGDVGPAPEVSWSGDRLTVGGQTGPSLTGPQGLKGDQGDQGLKGDKGDRGDRGFKGDRGDTGPANSLAIGTVTGGASAGATITGEAPEQTLSLVLPQGAKGDRGDVGPQGPPGVVSSASAYVIVGPGRPDVPSTTAGAIPSPDTTPVGARYESVDEAGVGARTWRKVAGGKWIATDGDTGARNVVGLKTSHWSTHPGAPWTIRRVGNMVFMSLPATTPANTNKVSVFSDYGALAGFRPSAWTTFVLPAPSGTGTVKYAFSPTSHDAQATASTVFEAVMVWVTAEPWPSTLPGSPT